MGEPVAPQPRPSRVGAFDGLRGWAALGVLLFHLTWELFGARFPVFRSYPVVVLTGGGSLAVAMFFITSGYLLTIHRWRVVDERRVLVQMTKRYVRLTVPVLGSTLIYWAVLALGLSHAVEAAAILDREEWLGYFGRVDPNLFDAITYGIYRAYVVDRQQNFGPFLWTMAVQLWGSFIVLPIAYGIRWHWAPYVALAVLIVPIFYLAALGAAILLGALFALVQRDLKLFVTPPERTESVIATIVFFVCIAVASAVERGTTMQGHLVQVPLGVVLLWAAMRSRPLAAFFTRPVSVFMGKISFPIYLVQCAVLISLTSWLVVAADAAGMLTEWTAVGIVAVSVAATLAASWAFLPVEVLAVRLVKEIDRAWRRTLPAPQTVPGTSP